jgi:hypothetical protein
VPPPIALALTLLLIGYLLVRDHREEPRVSGAIWIPILWLMINGSRQASQWFGGGPMFSMQALEEGNSVDKAVYGALIVAGVWVLARRHVRIGSIVMNNLPLALFLLYAGLSFMWSDVPAITFKRWVKAIGDPIMVLVLWSDPFPVRAVTAAIKRCAYVLIPLSVLFCKYYEDLGRTIDGWGNSSYTGVTLDKNMFGYLLFAFGLYFVSALLSKRDAQGGRRSSVRSDQAIAILMLLMVGWLLPVANSKTATLSLAVGIGIVVALRFGTVRRHLWAWALFAIVLGTVSEELLSVKEAVLEASGRDATFTGRTGLWETLLKEPINPLVGVGYASFWLGERLARFWEMYPTSPPIEAHNGYLEVYLNLGLIGLTLIVAVLLKALRTTRARVSASFATSGAHIDRIFATFGMAYSLSYLFYNITEATFQGLNILFVILMILGFDDRHVREPVQRRTQRSRTATWSERVETGPAK